ncbi:hypothetical protein NQ315_013791 [Exocentrus adspersus]|uniref:PID domain-containing protein n=1 Tax=Exocentrus adspersus TaxID=1586481 RepID=A0AAV8V7R6_9CUCU|nr:hypothetical protein NQ315_013791 [Exocentrus adspersus]
MAQDILGSGVYPSSENSTNVTTIYTLNSEMFNKQVQKDSKKRVFKSFINRLKCKKYASATISRPDPTYRVAYLGNVVTGWAKGEGCMEKPLATLWRNYTQSSRPDVRMQLTISAGGLKATTKDHGLTEYWAHRLTTCAAPNQFPRIFCWVYRHEGRRLRHELRCHAVLCPTSIIAKQIEEELKQSLALALLEFRRDKISRQNARLSLVNSLYENPTIPRRKILLSTGSHNYRPPLERSKSAPKLTSIEETAEEGDIFHASHNIYKEILKCYESSNIFFEKKKSYGVTKLRNGNIILPGEHYICEEKDMLSRQIKFDNESKDLILDEKSDMILEELVQNSLRNDLLESCEEAWFNALNKRPVLISHNCDNGSLSRECNSAGTMSDRDHVIFPIINDVIHEVQEKEAGKSMLDIRKTELDLKIEGNVLSQVKNLGKTTNTDIFKYCGLNVTCSNKTILDQDEEVSLIPVGESQSDFSSLKVYKKRSLSEPTCVINNTQKRSSWEESELSGACSDESGYEEDDLAKSVRNIVLI